jgi:Immunoglobulin domain
MFVVAPDITVEPPNVIVADQGQTVIIDCVAIGEPEPNISWRRGSVHNVIQNEDRLAKLPNNSLRFGQLLQHFTDYTAVNYWSCLVTVQLLPYVLAIARRLHCGMFAVVKLSILYVNV